MRRVPLSTGIALMLAVGLLAAVAVMPSLAQNPIEVQPLTGRAPFTDDVNAKFMVKLSGHPRDVINFEDPSLTQVVMFTVQPGAMFPWHSHEGAVVVNVTSGELV